MKGVFISYTDDKENEVVDDDNDNANDEADDRTDDDVGRGLASNGEH